MLTHERIWEAIDRLATGAGYSPSGLAKQAGLDPTAFNKSKRYSSNGKPRWPSTESIAKILGVTGVTMTEFLDLMDKDDQEVSLPLITMADVKKGGCFDNAGRPTGGAWKAASFRKLINDDDETLWALRANIQMIMSVGQTDTTLVVKPIRKAKKDDLVLIYRGKGDVVVGSVLSETKKILEVDPFKSDTESVALEKDQIEWVAKVLWIGMV